MVVESEVEVKLMEMNEEVEEGEELEMGVGLSTKDLAPKQVLVLWATMPAVPRFWAVGPSEQVARRGLAASLRAQGKVPAIQLEFKPPAEIDEELVCQIQA